MNLQARKTIWPERSIDFRITGPNFGDDLFAPCVVRTLRAIADAHERDSGAAAGKIALSDKGRLVVVEWKASRVCDPMTLERFRRVIRHPIKSIVAWWGWRSSRRIWSKQ